MFLEVLSAARDLGRLHDITSILIRFGFGDMVRRLGMGQALERAGKVLHWKEAEELARLEPPQRIRRALEELGPTFVKLGQILATRVDLLPPEYIAEFEKLQDQAPPLLFEHIRTQLEEDLGVHWEDVFSSLNTEPLAAASMAQVHRATLRDGDKVVLKIRRPGIRSVIEADLRLLTRLADIAREEIPESRRFQPNEIVHQFAQSMRRELDFSDECRSAERISASFEGDPHIRTPKVHWQWTGERLNVQEYIDAIPGRDLKAVDNAGMDRKLLAKRGADAVLKMILENGFFHADPHPGNVFYLPGEILVFIDFGMVGRLSVERRRQLVDLLWGMGTRDSNKVVEVLSIWAGETDLDGDRLAVEIDAFLDKFLGVSLKSLNFPAMIADFTNLLREHEFALPPDLALLTKAFITLEGMGRQLDPEFDMMAEAEPFLRRAMLARYAPGALFNRGIQELTSAIDLMTGLPRELRKLINTAQKGSVKFKVEIERLDQLTDRLDRSASRLTMGIVVAALIMGSSIVMTVKGGPTLLGLPFFGFLGFLGAVIGGVWLLLSIWRSGRG